MRRLLKYVLVGDDWAISNAEIGSLLVPYWKLTAEQKSIRTNILKRFLWGTLGVFYWIIGIPLAVTIFIVSIAPPFFLESLLFAGLAIIYAIILFPAVVGRWLTSLSAKTIASLRAGMLLISLVYVYPVALTDITNTKLTMYEDEERAALQAMTPEQRAKHLDSKKAAREAKELEDERRKAANSHEAKRLEQQKINLANQQALAQKEYAAQQKSAAKENNTEQRDFYRTIGSPKLLYRCKNSEFEKAIGAKVGSVNLLISSAQEQCGENGVEILKRSD